MSMETRFGRRIWIGRYLAVDVPQLRPLLQFQFKLSSLLLGELLPKSFEKSCTESVWRAHLFPRHLGEEATGTESSTQYTAKATTDAPE